MTRYIFRLAADGDEPAVHRLQSQFVAELNDPMGIQESCFARSDLVLLEVAHGGARRAVGLIGLVRASPLPFAFEQAFPSVWQRIDPYELTGRADVRRSDLVELDWTYMEEPYRGNRLALLLLAGCILHAHRRGYPACVTMGDPGSMDELPKGMFRSSGLVTHLAGHPYALGAFSSGDSAPFMADVVREACMRDPRIVWELPGAPVVM